MSQREPDPPLEIESWSRERLLAEVLALRARLNLPANSRAGLAGEAGDWDRFRTTLSTVRVPEGFEPVFLRAQDYVARYFADREHRPDEATIAIAGERYVLMRAASMSVEFVELVTSLYRERGPDEAQRVANNLLFDLAHAIGKADARSFHAKMGVTDPIERLSAGPVHFAFSGWAFVDIFPESHPSPDEDYYLIFDHPFSFESHAWLSKGKHSDTPVCIMNAGYSSGWCEESFGLPLVSAEVECVAAGGEHCRFIMAPPSRIEEHLERHARSTGKQAPRSASPPVAVPEFFQRRRLEDDLRRANERLEVRVGERTAELVRSNERLEREIAERRVAEEQLRLLGSAIESASEGIFIVAVEPSARPRITFVNQGLTRLTGRRAENLIGGTLEELGVTSDEHAVLEALERSLRGGVAFQSEATAKRADGAEYALELHVMPAPIPGQRLRHWIGFLRDVSERKSQMAALRRQAVHDALTELPNRVLLQDRLEQEILKTTRSGKAVGLLFMDLDGFKEINDTVGHHCGDLLLRQVGPRLRSRLRATDTVARLGGDEFAILLPGIDGVAAATRVARELLAALVEPFTVEAQQLSIGASIGIVLCPEHGSDPTTLMRRADVAMYVAKHGDRGFEVYSAEADAHSPERLTLLGELRGERWRDQLLLEYQPEVDLATGQVRRAEALVRWRHPERGLLLPKDFIPLAEAGNLVRALTEWVVRTAVRECRRWQEEGHAIGVSFNLSPRSLRDGALPGLIGDLLAVEGLDPSWLTLEVTEGSLLADPALAMSVLNALLHRGVGLAIDDFGAGYSSLVHLKHLPRAEIKIDRSFVSELTHNASDAAIVRSIIGLGHDLGRQVVAEGIEDRTTLGRLIELGCDSGQGYLIAPPLSAADLRTFFGSRRGA